ncbi:MAG: hypothetical protein Q9177_002864 [Variospora cf. flavescens]
MLSHFTHLPPEVILRLFQHATDFATVNALARTSSIFHCVWLMHANTIALTVLPKAIECYHEAHILVKLQEQVEEAENPAAARRKSHRELVIVLVRRVLINSRAITGFYERDILPLLENSRPNEYDIYARPLLGRTRIIKTLYHLKVLALAYGLNGSSPPVFPDIREDDLINLSEVSSWLRRASPAERRRELGVDELLTERRWLQNFLDNRLAIIHASNCMQKDN